MKRQVMIFISAQAKLMLDQMPTINQDDVMDWFCEVRKISLGGGDMVDYLNYKKELALNG